MPFDLSTAKPVSGGFDLSTAKPIKSTDWGRIAAEAAGGILGGIVALPEAAVASVPTLGVGGLATEAAGVGLGSAGGGQLYDIAKRYFTGEPAPSLGENLKTAAIDVGANALAPLAGRAVVAGAKMAAPYVAPYVRPIIEAIPGTTTKAQRLAKSLIQQATQAGEDVSYGAAQQKIALEKAAKDAAAKSALAKAQAKALEQYSETISSPSTTLPSKIGQAQEATAEIGAPVKTFTQATERNLTAERAKTDAYLRQTRDAIVADNEAKGVQMTDMPSYKALINKAEPIANWERSGAEVPDQSVANTYKQLLKTISPQTVELSADDAAIAVKNNIPVRQEGDKFYRDVTPTFKSIDNARRFLGEVFTGNAPEGYGAIKGKEQQDLYGLLKNIEEEYVGVAQPRLQNNYRDATAKINAFKEGVGPKIIGAEPEKVTPMLFSNKGAGAFDEAIAATGSERIPRKALSDQIATDMANKNYKQSLSVYNRYKQVLQNPKLADLKARVENHLQELSDNEIAGVETKNLALETKKQAEEQSQLAEQSLKQSTKYGARDILHTNTVSEILSVAEKNPEQASNQAIKYLRRLSDAGQISPEQYRSALNEYNTYIIPYSQRSSQAK